MTNNSSKNNNTNHLKNNTKTLKFSIIVSAKNEAEKIESLIDAIDNIDYSTDNFELIIIDDNSNDETYKVVENKIHSISKLNI